MELDDLARQVRAARRAAGLSQQALAERAGLSRARIEALENGRALDMKFGSVARILEALGLELRLGAANFGRPTLEELRRAQEAGDV